MNGSTRPSGKVGWLQRLASAAALGYVHHFPIERGKYRLIRLTRSFLVVKLAPGIFIRVPDLDHIGYKSVREGMYEPETVRVFAALLSPRRKATTWGPSRTSGHWRSRSSSTSPGPPWCC